MFLTVQRGFAYLAAVAPIEHVGDDVLLYART